MAINRIFGGLNVRLPGGSNAIVPSGYTTMRHTHDMTIHDAEALAAGFKAVGTLLGLFQCNPDIYVAGRAPTEKHEKCFCIVMQYTLRSEFKA